MKNKNDIEAAILCVREHEECKSFRATIADLKRKLGAVNKRMKSEWRVDLLLEEDPRGYNSIRYACRVPAEYIQSELIGKIASLEREIIERGEMP